MIRMTIEVTEAKIGRSTKKWAKRIGGPLAPSAGRAWRPRDGGGRGILTGAPPGGRRVPAYSRNRRQFLDLGVTLAPGRTRVRPTITMVSSPLSPSRTTR